MSDYADFISAKFRAHTASGFDYIDRNLPLFPHQYDLVRWAAKRGRAAIFADTGLGKTRMQLAWADAVVRHTGGNVLILAPLAVAEQTTEEGADIGVPVTHCRTGDDMRPGINITNYERLHRFDVSRVAGVVLDESSIIKHHDAKTFRILTEAFARTPYKLCATATPAPNDWTELGTHAEFLGIRSRTEMLAEFFTHDGGETQVWRLKGHARRAFWQWVASWGAVIRSPEDLGHDGSAYRLPGLHVTEHSVEHETAPADGMLFAVEALTLMARRTARRDSLAARVDACAQIINADSEPWVVWCDLNAEGDALRAAIPGAVEIRGSDDVDTKERRLSDFAHGRIRVLITKPSIAGFGLNWQHCARMAFVGVTDSFEAYYQSVRRCWRFGQKRPVAVHIFASDAEGAIVANLKRKERDAAAMGDALAAETGDAVRAEVFGASKETNAYHARIRVAPPSFLLESA
jgi:superfamily II DNA or RNA helicase